MSSGSETENLVAARAYDIEGVSAAYENRPTRGVDDEISAKETQEHEEALKSTKWNSAQVPLWKRLIGPSRRLVTDVESIYEDEDIPRRPEHLPEHAAPQKFEIMHSWIEESQNGDPTFYLNFVDKLLSQTRYDIHNVEWIHQKEDVKSFAHFKHLFTTHGMTDLVEGMDRLVIGLLKRVQKREERRFYGGYYLGPCAVRYDGQRPDDSEDRLAWFINFPYFSLQEQKEPSSHPINTDRAYPVRTLLQSRYRLEETRKRDSQQSVRKLSKQQANTCIEPWDARMDELDAGHCSKILYIPQLWVLSFSQETLITSSPISDEELYGSTLLKKNLSKTSDAQSSGVSLSLVRIIAEGDGAERDGTKKHIYLYPINCCDWWFGLLQKYRQISKELAPNENVSDDMFNLFARDQGGNERILTDKNWVEMLQDSGRYRKQNSPVLEVFMNKSRRPSVVRRVTMPAANRSTNEKSVEQIDFQVVSEISDFGAERTADLKDDLDRQISPKPVTTRSHATLQSTKPPTAVKGSRNQPDGRHRVPFFEWPLRKSARHEHEKRRSFRLKYILNKWLGNLMNDYVRSLESNDFHEEEHESTVEHIRSLEPRSLEQYTEDRHKTQERIRSQLAEDEDDSRSAQIDEICRASADLVTAFISVEVVYGEQFSNTASVDSQDASLSSYSDCTDSIESDQPVTKLPADYDTCVDNETISLYRGILATIVAFLANSPRSQKDLKYFLDGCSKIMAEINRVHIGVFTLRASQRRSFHDEFSSVGVVQKVMIAAFKEIMFLHLGLCRYLLSTSESNQRKGSQGIAAFIKSHIDRCCSELDAARSNLIADAAEIEDTPEMGHLVTAETVVILLLARLSKGVHRHGTIDVIDLYEKVVEKLAIEVDANASRKLLLEINKTLDELEIVKDVFQQQEKVLSLCHVLLDPITGFKNQNRRGAQFQYESESIETIRKATQERIADCEELRNRIVRLAKQNVQLVETQQDDNNTAILIFTVVTIIFLPLSFVTGLFGMNLRGFIDTSDGAGHFWAIAVPLTFAIVIPCLALAFWHPLTRLLFGVKILVNKHKIK